MFDRLLEENSKRLDVWGVYIDIRIRHYNRISESDNDPNATSKHNAKQVEEMRELFGKTFELGLKPFKMKFFFKK